jgi:AcrR family transcriptional regulator
LNSHRESAFVNENGWGISGDVTENATEKGYKPAQQARSRRTEQKFLDAAEAAFAKYGFAGARVADIISASGCSTGSFYHRFADKRDVFNVMLERLYDTLGADALAVDLARATHGDVQTLLSHYAERSFAIVQDHAGFYRAAYEISAQDPEVWNRLKGLTLIIGERVAGIAHEYADEIKVEDKQVALQHAVQVIITMAVHVTLGSGPLFPDDPVDLREVVVKAALGVLR